MYIPCCAHDVCDHDDLIAGDKRHSGFGMGGVSDPRSECDFERERRKRHFESASNVKTNLEGWQLKGNGNMEQTAEGLRLSSDSSENAAAISATRADDFVYEADVMITDMQADASLVFRSSVDGWSSYIANRTQCRLGSPQGCPRRNGRLKVEKALSLSQGKSFT